jgi:hypothetical protein
MGYNSVSVGTASTLILSANDHRISVVIVNTGTSGLFLGGDASITSSNGLLISSGSYFSEDSGGDKLYQGDFYGVSSSGVCDVRYWERTR